MIADFNNSYAALPPQIFMRENPVPVSNPQGIILNAPLADELGLKFGDDWQNYLAGNTVPQGADPLTQAYAGHQFGHWNPQLGDGRAVLLGEICANGQRFDIQLKGSGQTHWSRGGDGRAWLGPILREYLVSNAMLALGVPTTRALAAVATGDFVYREQGALPGAVITRIAPSHIRVGTFQYFSSRGDIASLTALFEHTRQRHYPQASTPADVLSAAVAAQADLIAKWMGLGFIHGVMNTDNCHVAGITIDYGPCAFMDHFHPMKVFSSIDRQGRYAYGNQPQMAAWNMAQFATALLPLCDDRDAAIKDFTEIVHGFGPAFASHYKQCFAAKLGLDPASDNCSPLIDGFMDMMAAQGADFTNSFAAFQEGNLNSLWDHPNLQNWQAEHSECAKGAPNNPKIIPRNHIIEQLIQNAVAGNFDLFHRFNAALQTPFAAPKDPSFAAPPRPDQEVSKTFCGT